MRPFMFILCIDSYDDIFIMFDVQKVLCIVYAISFMYEINGNVVKCVESI